MSQAEKHPIHALSDALVEELCDLSPVEATYAGVEGRDHLWADLSPEGGNAHLAAIRNMQHRVAELPAPSDRWDGLAIDVAGDYLSSEATHYEHDEHLRDLNSIASPVQYLREVFDHMNKDTQEGWVNIATRLESMGEALDGYVASLDAGLRRGMAVASRQVDEAIRQAAVTASDDSQFQLLAGELAQSGLADPSLTSRLETAIVTARAAYGMLGRYLENTYAKDSVAKDAVGRERYIREVSRFIGTTLDPEETYTWGWEQVAQLWERMQVEADRIAPGGGIAGALDVLKSEPKRAAENEDELTSFLAERIDEALSRLSGTHFHVPDEIRECDVKIAPPGGSLGAYYVPPSEDFSRRGSVWWSIDRSVPTPLYDQVSTAYHEGFPGHHLQCGIQVGLRDKMTRLQRIWVWQSGSGEGWALYAERLMDELGYLDTPDYVFGFLTSQMLRACRVVVDIGTHLELPIPTDQPFQPGEQWTFERAVALLEHYATLEHPYAVSEVNRYFGWPAQAISYKVGERAILDMRRRAETEQGDAFDPKQFHQRLLEVGPVGLDLVEKYIFT